MRKFWHRLGRFLLVFGFIVLVLAIILTGAGAFFIGRTLPQTTGTLSVAGLQAPVSVLRDRWGVPRITGSDLHDVAFAQGYVTAQDRLFQMEFNRRVAQGQLAEMFGAGPDNSLIEADEFLRTLDLYSSARVEMLSIDPRVLTELQAYSDGINAFITSHSSSLPLEFTILGITPAKWTPLDSLAYGRVVALSLDENWYTKYTRAMVLAKVGPDVTSELFPPYPSQNPTLIAADGTAAPLTSSAPPSPGLAASTGGAALARVSPQTVAAFAHLPAEVLRGAATVHDLLGGISDALGSNDWVVDGSKTTTGKPLLANDPHLGINMPSIWYEVGLRGGGLDVIGYSFPGVPGVIIGHNADIAWGVTNVGADDTDLYMEHLDPAGHPGMYEYHGDWLPLQTHQETIRVRGGASVTFTVSATRHGPLLNSVVKDLKGFTPVALKWTALQPGYTFAGFFQVDEASDWNEFQAAVGDISISQNFVYADTRGNIGYLMSGLLPLRPADNDLLPVDGTDPAFEWQGYVPNAQMPRLSNPPTHIIATANNQIVPDSPGLYVTADWDQGYRARRIIDLLNSKSPLSISDIEQVQTDVYTLPAAQLVPVLTRVGTAAGGDAALAAHLLQGWDYRMTANSGAAALYEATAGELIRSIGEQILGKKLYEVYRDNYSMSGLYSMLLSQVATPQPPFFGAQSAADATTARDTFIASAMARAMSRLRVALGSDTSQWQWGKLHQAHFDHPLASVTPLNLIFGTSPVARAGDGVTVNIGGDGHFTSDPPNYDQRSVPSMRQIIDLGNFDNSLWVTTTGESGQPFSPHYFDLAPLWNAGTYQSMAYSPEAETKATAAYLQLKPA